MRVQPPLPRKSTQHVISRYTGSGKSHTVLGYGEEEGEGNAFHLMSSKFVFLLSHLNRRVAGLFH